MDQLRESLERARDEFVAGNSVDFENDENLCPRLPSELSFFALPEQQLLAYEKHRETSELGHIFRIANGLHDFIDAMVMIGSGGGCLGARAVAQACCDPFHNEQTRAARGSKPRSYFVDNELDNDQLHSLISRLKAGGYGDGPGEKRWTIIAADQPTGSQTNEVLLEHLIETLRQTDPTPREELRQRLVTSIGQEGNLVAKRMKTLGFGQALRVPANLKDSFSVLTPIGMLSSAFLGLDCIQLLVGAAAMNENLKNATFSENLVLRYVAANCSARPDEQSGSMQGGSMQGGSMRGRDNTFHAVWSRCLLGVAQWNSVVRAESVGTAGRLVDLATESGRTAFFEQFDSGAFKSDDAVCNHVVVDRIRTDGLPASPGKSLEPAEEPLSITDLQKETVAATESRLAEAGIRQNKIVLPVIDTHTLGQWLQMMMLSAAIESMLLSKTGV